eukprot:5193955-Pyramimonas_sp.AAC.1
MVVVAAAAGSLMAGAICREPSAFARAAAGASRGRRPCHGRPPGGAPCRGTAGRFAEGPLSLSVRSVRMPLHPVVSSM